jgi:hypothetical protein
MRSDEECKTTLKQLVIELFNMYQAPTCKYVLKCSIYRAHVAYAESGGELTDTVFLKNENDFVTVIGLDDVLQELLDEGTLIATEDKHIRGRMIYAKVT